MKNNILYALAAIDGIVELPDRFLTKREIIKADSFRFPKRRAEWLAGRLTLKRLIRSVSGFQISDLRRIEIIPDENGKPGFALDGKLRPEAVSISHRENLCAAAIRIDGKPLGVDLEKIEAKTSAFENDYFSPAERSIINADPDQKDLRLASHWSAKESVLKTVGVGLRIDLRKIEITESDPIRCADSADLYGYAKLERDKKKGPGFILYRILFDGLLMTAAAELESPAAGLRKIEI